MKVLFIFNQLLGASIGSGGDVKALKVLGLLRSEKGCDVEVICPFSSRSNFKGLKVHNTGKTSIEKFLFSKNIVSSILPAYFARTFEAIKLLGEINADSLYTTGDFFCNTIPSFIYKKRKPEVRWLACIYHINPTPFERKNNPFLRNCISYFSQRLSFLLIKLKCDVIFVLNSEVKDSLMKMGFKNKIVISGAGITSTHIRDTKDLLQKISKYRKLKKEDRLSFFARLNPTKGIFDLPEILKRVLQVFPDFKLDIIGDSDHRTLNLLKGKFKENGCVKNVVFHGFIPEKEKLEKVYPILAKSKVFLLPSYEEGWCITLFEAIMCGSVPVVYDLPVFREIFRGKLLTAPFGDTQLFSEIVIGILKKDHRNYRSECYKIAVSYSWEKVFNIEKLEF